MRVAAAAAFAGVASATWAGHGGSGSWGPPSNGSWPDVYVTEVVTAYTTYCPEATQLTHNGVTYTVSEATTLTITNCPCTVTKPVTTAPVVTGTAPSKPWSSGAGVKPPGTAPAPSGTGVWTGLPSGSSSPITPSTGAASQLQVGIAAVLAVFGLVAAL